VCPRLAGAAAPQPPGLLIADFDADETSRFPHGWQSRERQAVAEGVYRIAVESDEHFLHAEALGNAVQIGMPVSFHLSDYPLLSWRWRIAELPRGGNERDAATNDSAAGVYVVFKGGLGGLLPRAIKYVWSAQEPRGTSLKSPGYSNARIVVLQSGAADLGSWRVETVNVAADYRRLFQSEPPELRGIAVLTDADDTGSRAIADYDDFRALPLSGAAALPSDADVTAQQR